MFCVNDYVERFQKTYKKIVDSGLLNDIEKIYVTVVGTPPYDINFLRNNPKIQIEFGGNSKNESDTLRSLWDFCENNNYCNVLYLHSKGVTKPGNKNIDEWSDLMEYFLIEKYKDCLFYLSEYDTCGVNYRKNPMPHYSGNFWWATSSYILSRDRFDRLKNSRFTPQTFHSTERHYCEFWLLDSENGNHKILYNSNINHYRQNYPREIYVPKTYDSVVDVISKRQKSIKIDRRENNSRKLLSKCLKECFGENYDKKKTTNTKFSEILDLFHKIMGK
jgi:hypothetical protein